MLGLLFVLISIYGIKLRLSNIGHDAHLGGVLLGMLMAVGIYPESLQANYLPIVLVITPTLAFIFLIIKHLSYLLRNLRLIKKIIKILMMNITN